MKEKRGVNTEARQRMRQRIAQWEGRGQGQGEERDTPDLPPEHPPALGKERHLWVTTHPPRPPRPGEEAQVCVDLTKDLAPSLSPPAFSPTSSAFSPTSPSSSSSFGSSLQENGTSGMTEMTGYEEPLLRESSTPLLSTPVRNAAVKRFWQQQVW